MPESSSAAYRTGADSLREQPHGVRSRQGQRDRQAVLTNHTPFAADRFVLPTPDGQEAVLVVLAATLETGRGGVLAPAEVQPAVLAEDFYAGSPGSSSLLAENELPLVRSRSRECPSDTSVPLAV